LQDRISLLRRGDILVHRTSLTLPLFIEVPVPSQESDFASFYKFIEVPVPSQESDFASFYKFSIGYWKCFQWFFWGFFSI
jgi:hypothetical protein